MTTKVCRICKIEKELSQFHPNKSCKLGVVGTCIPCGKIRLSKWYFDNRLKRQQIANTNNQKRKKDMVEYFGNKCNDCGEQYPQYVYQFHHVDPALKDVNPSKALSWAPERMWKELSKCIMLCANCHMIRHHERKEAINCNH